MSKKNAITVLKIIISVASIYLVLQKVRFNDIVTALMTANNLLLILSLMLYILSKMISALRTFTILEKYKIPFSILENLKIYWTAMYYNLFLPGGIGGDIYRTILINRRHKAGLKLSTSIVLMDRTAGLTALIASGLICLLFTSLKVKFYILSALGVPFILLLFAVFTNTLLPRLKSRLVEITIQSFLVQLCQIYCLWLILYAFRITSDYQVYILIFLVSSIAAMLPFSVGGIGVREFVFLSLSTYFNTDQKTAVAVSFTFYLITVAASIPGLLIQFKTQDAKYQCTLSEIHT